MLGIKTAYAVIATATLFMFRHLLLAVFTSECAIILDHTHFCTFIGLRVPFSTI